MKKAMSYPNVISFLRACDSHGHLRQDSLMDKIIWAFMDYLYVVCMGNTNPPIRNAKEAQKYESAIMQRRPKFAPVMTVMLNEAMLDGKKANIAFLDQLYAAGVRIIKFIPAGTSTNAVINITLPELVKYYPVLEYWAILPNTAFSIHLELINSPFTGNIIPEIDREHAALPFASDLITNFADCGMAIVFEHASTYDLVRLTKDAPENFFAGLTLQHATITYDMVRDPATGKIINPHLYGMPIAKMRPDVKAVREKMTSGNRHFIWGSDCAGHWTPYKQGPCPRAGILTPGEVAIPALAQLFADDGKLQNLQPFLSTNWLEGVGKEYLHTGEKTTLIKQPWVVPADYGGLVPIMAGETLQYQILRDNP